MADPDGAALVAARFANAEIPLARPIQSGRLVMTSRQYCCVSVERADGVVGEAFVLTRGTPVASVLDNLVLPRILGTTADQGLELLVALRNAGWSGPISRAVGVAELARLDAGARAAGLPVWRQLGHPAPPDGHSVVVAIGYSSPGQDGTQAALLEAEDAASRGARMVKLMGGAGSPADDLAQVARVVDAVDGACEVALDVNGAWSAAEAADALPKLRAAGVTLVEDPYPYELNRHPEHPVDDAGDWPKVALGEVLASPLEVAGALAWPFSHVRLDATVLGGPSMFAEALRLARAAGRNVVPHFWPDYHRQLLPAGAQGDMVEGVLPQSPWFGLDRFASGLAVLEDGALTATKSAGFGIDLDWQAIAGFAANTGGVMTQRVERTR